MSWSCEICGKGHYEDHSECRKVEALNELSERIDELTKKIEKLCKLLSRSRRKQVKEE